MRLGNDFNWDMFASELGTQFSVVDPGINIKRFPAYIYLQWPTEAVLNLKHRNNLQADDLEYLELELPPVRSDLSRRRSPAERGTHRIAGGRNGRRRSGR